MADFERSPLELHVFPSREFSLSCKSESRAGPEYSVHLRAGIFAMVLPVFSGGILHGCPWLQRVPLWYSDGRKYVLKIGGFRQADSKRRIRYIRSKRGSWNVETPKTSLVSQAKVASGWHTLIVCFFKGMSWKFSTDYSTYLGTNSISYWSPFHYFCSWPLW